MTVAQSTGAIYPDLANKTVLVTVEGSAAKNDLFDGIDLSWKRYKGGAQPAQLLDEAVKQWKPEHPEETIPLLTQIQQLARKIDDPDAQEKVREIDETIGRCAGLWLDFSAAVQDVVSNQPVKLKVSAIRRTGVPVTLMSLSVNGKKLEGSRNTVLQQNVPMSVEERQTIDAGSAYTQPYWLISPPEGDRYVLSDMKLTGLAENPPPLALTAAMQIGDAQVNLERPVVYRYIDRLRVLRRKAMRFDCHDILAWL